MKKVLLAVVLLLAYFMGYNQCVPNAATGNPGVTPPPDSIPCIERGVLYNFTMQIENFDTFSAAGSDVIIHWMKIDSITNFPCGISWQVSKDSLGGGETACIDVSGTTYDLVGQYPLQIYLTINLTAPLLGNTTQSGEVSALIQQAQGLGVNLPIDLVYVSRVIEAGNPCPAIDPNANLTSGGLSCPAFSVSITGNPFVCAGSPATLTATSAYNTGTATYSWSPGGETTQSISVTTLTTYTVVANDGSTTATASQAVTTAAIPVSNFTFSNTGMGSFSFTNTSTSATSYAWNFGDAGSASNTSASMSPAHTYYANGTYDVTLIASSLCGADTVTQQVTVTGLLCDSYPPTGNPGVTPPPDSIPCIERGVFYEFTMHTENFDTLSILGTDVIINWTKIDSITNLPCGINWQASKDSFAAGETGCIYVSGTTYEPVGQYPLKIYMSFNITTILGTFTQGGEVIGLIQQGQGLGINIPTDLAYVSRVIEAGGSCPAIDTNASGTTAGTVCPAFSVAIAGTATICQGGSTTLSATPLYNRGGSVTYSWSPGSATTQSINVTTVGTYSVVANDGSTTATTSITVTQGAAPGANFTSSNTGNGNFSYTSTSTGGATSFSWNFGDPASSSNSATTAAATHTYTANGTYSVTLIATNACGSDTSTQSVTAVGVFITPIKTDNVSMSLYPNPNTGTFELDLVTSEQNANYQLKIFDAQGKVVYTEALTTNSNKVHQMLQLENLSSGIYTVNLNSRAIAYIQKLVIF